MVGEDNDQVAARIAKGLRAAGTPCEIFNPFPTDAAVLRRDRIVILLALAFVTMLAWGYLLWLAADMDMGGMDMSGFRMIPSGTGLMIPAETPWRPIEFLFVFIMWTVMMVGMMTPSAVPMILMYARVARQSDVEGKPLAPTVWFAIGYFNVWVAFAALATLAQWVLERAALLDSRMALTTKLLGGLLFVAAGSYQWTSLKDTCLAKCWPPFALLIFHGGFRRDAAGCLLLGFRYGAYCVGCCWALMVLLFVGGVMNVVWILALAVGVLLEKVTPVGRLIAPVAGIVLIAAGAWLFATAMP